MRTADAHAATEMAAPRKIRISSQRLAGIGPMMERLIDRGLLAGEKI